MRIAFDVAGTPVEFRRNAFWGSAELRVGGAAIRLQHAADPTTHFELSLTKVWRHRVGDHEVVVEKVRPLLLAGLRPQTYRVKVDGQMVAERVGY